VLIEVEKLTERCVMVTLGQGDVPVALHLLSHLAANRDGCFGVYARILSSGTVAVGDQVADGS
jgi:MOSC domain-containing protein YiiM